MPARAPSHSPWRHSSPPSAPANRPSSLSISATRTAKARDTLSMARSSLLSPQTALSSIPPHCPSPARVSSTSTRLSTPRFHPAFTPSPPSSSSRANPASSIRTAFGSPASPHSSQAMPSASRETSSPSAANPSSLSAPTTSQQKRTAGTSLAPVTPLSGTTTLLRWLHTASASSALVSGCRTVNSSRTKPVASICASPATSRPSCSAPSATISPSTSPSLPSHHIPARSAATLPPPRSTPIPISPLSLLSMPTSGQSLITLRAFPGSAGTSSTNRASPTPA